MIGGWKIDKAITNGPWNHDIIIGKGQTSFTLFSFMKKDQKTTFVVKSLENNYTYLFQFVLKIVTSIS